MKSIPLLTLTTFLPLAGGLLVAVLPKDSHRMIRLVTLATTLGTFVLSLGILAGFEVGYGGFQMVERANWVRSAGAEYHLGVDGISLWMVLLTTFLLPISVLASWTIEKRVKAFHVVLLVLETGI
ncbi:MAG TPA: hypothetical protein VNA87_07440, partial [Actinomycetota bacterium]|nr:hypothetical protein [Actinomycetota bacterium]